MRAALAVGGRALRDLWDGFVTVAVLNVLWLTMSFTIVLLPPATVAMFEATHELARGRTPSIGEFLRSVPRHFLRAWAWALLNLAVGVVLLVNLGFYGQQEPWALAVRTLLLLVALIWLLAQLLVWPYLFEQAEASLRRALRNALLTVLAAPGFSLVLGLIVAAAVALSIVLVVPPALFTAAFLGLLGSHAVRDRLVAFGKLPAPPATEEEGSRGS